MTITRPSRLSAAVYPLAADWLSGCRLGKHPQHRIDCHVEPVQTLGLVQDLRLLEYHGFGPLHKPTCFSGGFLTSLLYAVIVPLYAVIVPRCSNRAAQDAIPPPRRPAVRRQRMLWRLAQGMGVC